MEDAKVQILMSTYNGQKYLREQIDSLLGQTYSNIEILIRDDGSKDDTPLILKEYEEKYDNIHVFLEDNKGVTSSFFDLLAKSDASYVAFCDQDDVWLKDKIERAVNKLKGIQGQGLYFANKYLVNAELKIISEGDTRKLEPIFGNALVESIGSGCTMMLNRKLTNRIKENIPQDAIIHDWWIYLVATYLGTVIYDPIPSILYRQHGNNEVGGSVGWGGQIKSKAKYLKKSRGKLAAQLLEFQHIYKCDVTKDAMVDEVLKSTNLKSKYKLIFDRRIFRQNRVDNFVMHCLVLMGRML